MNRRKVLDLLKNNKSWYVRNKGIDEIKIFKEFGQKKVKVISFILVCTKDGLHFKHPHYEFKCAISHFSAVQKDVRLSLNKSYLKSIVRSLKELGVWKNIINKEFLTVNEQNSKSDKELIKKELTFLLR